ncbi:MAG: HAMP domain-containing sensor histidine kinase [bacterium]|nr:HAMP domain-containing sensor histidine kinase [bacterium]
MKKILLSNIFKTAVITICAICSAMITYTAINSYISENNAEYSHYFEYPAESLLNTINDQIVTARNSNNRKDAETSEENVYTTPIVTQEIQPTATEQPIFTNVLEIERAAKMNSDKLDYYISVPSQNILITNQDIFDENKFLDAEYTNVSQRINGQSSYYGNIGGACVSPSGTADYQIFIALKSAYADSYKSQKNSSDGRAEILIRKLTILAAVLLCGMFYLIITAGRKYKEDEIHMYYIDKLKVEANLILIGAVISAILIYILIIDTFTPEKLAGYSASAVGVGFVPCALLGLSLVRQIKNHSFWKNTFIFIILRKIKYIWNRFIGGKHMKYVLHSAAKDKYGAIYIAAAFIYIALAVLSPLTAIIATIALVYLIVRRMSDLYKIRRGVEEICGGNTAHKIEDCKFPDYKLVAERINEMGEGMKEAIDRGVRSERMKAELITNVSHDLKTPLTSIISYAKLLEELNPEPAEARDYVAIIQKKGEQLKKLSTELFEISKAQSGNAEVDMEKLDINLLINQALGELNGDIEKSGLDFIVKTNGELFIEADGKKLSRVFENLIVNILKYSLKGTRVFINTSEENGKATAIFRNISENPLDFDAEEITERFVRGDSSRTGDGNGLGLAIAKSYTELCGGSFKITVDGDLFKAELEFQAHTE